MDIYTQGRFAILNERNIAFKRDAAEARPLFTFGPDRNHSKAR